MSQKNEKKKHLEQEKPVLDAFWSWVVENANSCLPESKLNNAINYAINQKEDLLTYLQDGNCSIANNLAENSIHLLLSDVETDCSVPVLKVLTQVMLFKV